jgi:threonine/homoserine/homoserine lactone efflux protein
MPEPSALVGFATLALVLIAVPGPSVLFIVGRGVALGRRAALLTVLGNTAGAYLLSLGVALGLGSIVVRSVVVFNTLKWVGAIYLMWLGWKTFRDRRTNINEALVESAKPNSTIVREGFIVGATNPKTTVFFAAILPQFITTSGAVPALQMIVLATVFAAIALISDSIWALAAGTTRQWFSKSPNRLRRMKGAGGLTILGVGLKLMVTGSGD